MKKVVAYCRYSSDKQNETSIEAQIRHIEGHCEKKNLKLKNIL